MSRSFYGASPERSPVVHSRCRGHAGRSPVVTVAAHSLRTMDATSSARWADTLGVFDLETTGIDVDTDRIVTAHVGVLGAGGEVLERRDWLADPGRRDPRPRASLIHGVTHRARAARGRAGRRAPSPRSSTRSRHCCDRRHPDRRVQRRLRLLAPRARGRAATASLPCPIPAPVIDPLVIDKAFDRYRRGKRTLTAVAAHYAVGSTTPTRPAPTPSPPVASPRRSPRASPSSPRSRSTNCTPGRSTGPRAGRELPGLPSRQRRPRSTTSGAWPVRRAASTLAPRRAASRSTTSLGIDDGFPAVARRRALQAARDRDCGTTKGVRPRRQPLRRRLTCRSS